MKRSVTVVTLVAGASMLGIGIWCRIDPAGFAEWANWPEHEHFLHDAGVFQIGIGLMMIAALAWRDVVSVVLGGVRCHQLPARGEPRRRRGRRACLRYLAPAAVVGHRRRGPRHPPA
ncbi:hypothetical protein [Nocardia abscessus]|uniref:hypothetical protein n=1 Tax=Nocardia abscessus TaxID=120957 RepID=UPI002456C9CC|nr:hypothetical protein [Nocardia abscessus]